MADKRTRFNGHRPNRRNQTARFVWAQVAGVVEVETKKAIRIDRVGETPLWLPKRCLRQLTYVEGGDSRQIRVGQSVESIELQQWLARERDLYYER